MGIWIIHPVHFINIIMEEPEVEGGRQGEEQAGQSWINPSDV